MEGVILFADDHVFHPGRIENDLFQKFNLEEKFSILPINNLSILEKTVSSVSTYRALILDWNFKQDSGVEGVSIPDATPYKFLKDNKIFSLIYVYSQADIPQEQKEELEKLYPNKIFFALKETDKSIDEEHKKISDGIEGFENSNQHLKTPFLWSQAINSSVQAIFNELESADPNWIKEIYLNAKNDGAEPNTEVIGVFQNLLNESIIQNEYLIKSLAESSSLADVPVANKEESLAKLYNRIYYTQLIEGAPIMTGDIFQFSDDEFAIVITPECDVNSKSGVALEFLIFSKKASAAFIADRKKKDDRKFFNNDTISRHILPSFPFVNDTFNLTALIDFKQAFAVILIDNFKGSRTSYKLNSPFIYQLRQRYLSFIGRVGVPAMPPSLISFNLK
jgi:hypothetical protein